MTHCQQNPLVSPLRFTAIIIILSCAVISSTLIFLPCWRCIDGDQRESLVSLVSGPWWAGTEPARGCRHHQLLGVHTGHPKETTESAQTPRRAWLWEKPSLLGSLSLPMACSYFSPDSSLLAAFRYLFPLPSPERAALPEKSRVTLSRTYSMSSILISSITPKITKTELQYCIACTFKLLCLIANILCICYISYIKPVVSTHNFFKFLFDIGGQLIYNV